MSSAKLLRYWRSSDNQKKRKTQEKAKNAKRWWSHNTCTVEAEKAPINPEKTDQGLESRANTPQNTNEMKLLQETADHYHRHVVHFSSKWKEVEMGSLQVIKERDLTIMESEIGGGCFATCYLAKFGACTVMVKKQQNSQASRQEARMTARLSHPRQNRVEIVTTFYNVNGEWVNLGDIPNENTTINWTYLFGGLCRGIQHIHDKAKILQNDMKSNSKVLDGRSLAEAEAVLVDFGKATD